MFVARASQVILFVSLAACSTKAEPIAPSHAATDVRKPAPAAASANQAITPIRADSPAQAASTDTNAWTSGRRYVSTRTARSVLDLSFCPDGRVVYYDEGKPRIGTFTVEELVVHARYGKSSEDYALSGDLKTLTLPGGTFVVSEGLPKCTDLPTHSARRVD